MTKQPTEKPANRQIFMFGVGSPGFTQNEHTERLYLPILMTAML